MFPLIECVPRLFLASIVGFFIGLERATQKNKKSVGVGTCSLICLITCSLAIVGKYMLGSMENSSRFISNIMTSISFLCGGVIFVKSTEDKHEDMVVGLTTGTILFGVSSIGIMIGLGYWQFALTLATLFFIILKTSRIFKNIQKYIKKNEKHNII